MAEASSRIREVSECFAEILDALGDILTLCIEREERIVVIMGGCADRWGCDHLLDDFVNRARAYANHRFWEQYTKTGAAPNILIRGLLFLGDGRGDSNM